MLRLKVETCKWQCLQCNREFSSKFCYLLHVKSLHGRLTEHRSNKDLVRPLEESANCSRIPTVVVERSFDGNGPTQHEPVSQEAHSNTEEGDLTCDVCKKTYSRPQKLTHHKKLHLNASKNLKRKALSQKPLLNGSKPKKFKKRSLLATGH